MRFRDKVVFVTGGAKGLGKAMVKAFLDEGAKVGVNGRNAEAVAKFEEEFKGKAIKAFVADIADYQGMEAVAKNVVEEWGGVDILINNAGIVNPLATAEKTKKEDFDRVIDVNLKGVFYTSQIFGKKMIEKGSGRIISISSQVALFGEKGFLPYSVSKAGVQIMTRNLAFEWSRFGVTLCCVAPGFIGGGMNEALIKRQPFVDFLSGKTPIGRMGKVEELVATILFLASPEAQYINGETIVMDGGMTGYSESLLDMIMKGK
ncbi:MAG: Gluconate 5-dehydrogenase [Syntrophorhabdaceae bacterium PtaU1.Bin034]|jgi:NAD(P)-dependent dehydrogenase (short-subunit alcohol dehydrogenase family)|nr:MAG: Gluconate 5-dehydrogenase [Syntrophorhabdaceae bacterium PtaU1.Bin034]